MPLADIRIEPVRTRSELRAFIMFPFSLYGKHPYWVPPLIGERFKHFDPQRNPFYQHAEVQLFRALRDDKTVGVIAAIDDSTYEQVWNEPVGFFGEFEVIEDYAVAAALFDTARQWLAARGRKIMRGPMNLNINDECALLIKGFDGRPVIMMTYNPSYYQTFIERYGFAKAKDLNAFYVDLGYGPNLEGMPEQVSRVARIARDRYHVEIKNVEISKLKEMVEEIKPIHRAAWSKNWGALPMTDAEYDYLAEQLAQVIDQDMSYLAYLGGKPVGAFLVLPDYNQVAYRLRGRLFPIGWLKFLWYKRKITGIRVIIMGVLEEHRLEGHRIPLLRRGLSRRHAQRLQVGRDVLDSGRQLQGQPRYRDDGR